MAVVLAAAIYPKPTPRLVFMGSTFNATDLTTYTFSNQVLGEISPFRTIIIGLHCEDAATAFSVSSMSVRAPGAGSGIAATSRIISSNTPAIKAGIFTAPVRSGYIGDVVVTFSEAITSCGISIWAAYNLQSEVPYATATGTADAANLVLITKGGGFIIATSTNAAAGDTCTWTLATEQYDTNATDIQMTGAHLLNTDGGSKTVVADYVTGTAVQSAAAAFR